MTAGALLVLLHRRGAGLRLHEGRLQCHTGTIAPDLLALLRSRKPALLDLLAGPVRGLPDPLRQEWWPSAMFLACAELEEALTASGADHARRRAFWSVDRELTAWSLEMNRRVDGSGTWPRDEAWAEVWESGGEVETADVVQDDATAAAPPMPEAAP